MGKEEKTGYSVTDKPDMATVRTGAPTLDKVKMTLVPSGLAPQQIAQILSKNDTNLTGVAYAKTLLNYTFGMMWDFQVLEHAEDGVSGADDYAHVVGRLILNHPTGQTLVVRDRVGWGKDINDAADDALVECLRYLGADL